MPELKLFHLPGARSRVSLTALELTRAPFEVVVPIFHKGALAELEYRARNPLGQVRSGDKSQNFSGYHYARCDWVKLACAYRQSRQCETVQVIIV